MANISLIFNALRSLGGTISGKYEWDWGSPTPNTDSVAMGLASRELPIGPERSEGFSIDGWKKQKSRIFILTLDSRLLVGDCGFPSLIDVASDPE